MNPPMMNPPYGSAQAPPQMQMGGAGWPPTNVSELD